MSRQAFSFSGDDAMNYDKYLGPLLFEPAALEFLPFAGDPGIQEVLEISSGTGRLTGHLRQYFSPKTKLTASDLSRDMLDLAKHKLHDASVEYEVADAQELPFENNRFDIVVCQFGLMFFPDKSKAFQEVFRVLKPGGRFIFSTWDSVESMPLIDLIINQTIIPFFNGADKEKFHVPFSLHDRNILLSYLSKSGFSDNRVAHLLFKAGRSTPEDVVNGFLLRHPLGRVVAEKDPAMLEPMAVALTKKISVQFGSPYVDAVLKMFIAVGEK